MNNHDSPEEISREASMLLAVVLAYFAFFGLAVIGAIAGLVWWLA